MQPGSLKLRGSQAGIAQLVEHDLAKVGVASSSLVSRSSLTGMTSASRGHVVSRPGVPLGSGSHTGPPPRPGGRVVMQRPAKPRTPVRFRPWPPNRQELPCPFGVRAFFCAKLSATDAAGKASGPSATRGSFALRLARVQLGVPLRCDWPECNSGFHCALGSALRSCSSDPSALSPQPCPSPMQLLVNPLGQRPADAFDTHQFLHAGPFQPA